MKNRGSGVLMHITSLPSPYGIGDLGPWAYRFADFLSQTKQHYWQILPLNPTDPEYGNSPYHSIAAFANNLLLISPELLVQDGFCSNDDLQPLPSFPEGRVAYGEVIPYKMRIMNAAFARCKSMERDEQESFYSENGHWLEDFSLFIALKEHFDFKPWCEWPEEVRDRKPSALKKARKQLREKIEMEKFYQYLFYKQWLALKGYTNSKGVQIFGDMPIYVDYDSVDVWKEPTMFKLDQERKPSVVAGVPPDYFSETGQRWGNPVYRWEMMKKDNYVWWMSRVKHTLKLFDMVRIDHFRGLVSYWEIPASEKTAIIGKWVEAPADDFFKVLLDNFPDAPIIAEDLGIITPDVREAMDRYKFPGMKVLIFAFGDDLATNPYLPHNHVQNCIVYTGTHDNNTVKGWFENEVTPEMKEKMVQYLGHELSTDTIHLELMRIAMMSVAAVAIFPMQDILGLGEEHRMNRPSTIHGNWEWRLLPEMLTPEVEQELREMTESYGRG